MDTQNRKLIKVASRRFAPPGMTPGRSALSGGEFASPMSSPAGAAKPRRGSGSGLKIRSGAYDIQSRLLIRYNQIGCRAHRFTSRKLIVLSHPCPALHMTGTGLMLQSAFQRRTDMTWLFQIVMTSASIMVLELTCIRWIAGSIRLFGFFINFALLAAILGVGAGILAKDRRNFAPVAIVVTLLFAVTPLFANQLTALSSNMLFFSQGGAIADEPWIALPIIFGLITLTFIPLGQILGRLLASAMPLPGYAADIVGSLLGIAAFVAMSAMSLPPALWLAAFAIVLAPIVPRLERRFTVITLLSLSAAVFANNYVNNNPLWSSYYKINVLKADDGSEGYDVSVNNVGHQFAGKSENKESFYHRAYDLFGDGSFKSVLIIGAGTGSDVAIALAHGAEKVTAVEIDRELHKIGKAIHPDRPYDDPRVRVVIDDGRAFLRGTQEKYDLIVFALTDSLTLTSGYANLRLESFLYTQESIAGARDKLSDDGLLVMYNYYREPWLIKKLSSIAASAFGYAPFVTTYGSWGRAAVVMAGPRLQRLDSAADQPYREGVDIGHQSGRLLPVIGAGRMAADPSLTLSSDDWPFFYLKEAGIPSIYHLPLLIVVLFAACVIRFAAPAGLSKNFSAEMFFMGAAFMLLQTRSLVTFALLFGTTWLVNALVFFAILSSVLISIAVSSVWKIQRVSILYVVLFALLALNYVIPVQTFLGIESAYLRYPAVAIFAFSPVFVANLIFSQAFAKVDQPDTSFAWNLIGIMAGGILEYTALMTGYRGLLPIVALCYAAAFLSARRRVGAAAGGIRLPA